MILVQLKNIRVKILENGRDTNCELYLKIIIVFDDMSKFGNLFELLSLYLLTALFNSVYLGNND